MGANSALILEFLINVAIYWSFSVFNAIGGSPYNLWFYRP